MTMGFTEVEIRAAAQRHLDSLALEEKKIVQSGDFSKAAKDAESDIKFRRAPIQAVAAFIQQKGLRESQKGADIKGLPPGIIEKIQRTKLLEPFIPTSSLATLRLGQPGTKSPSTVSPKEGKSKPKSKTKVTGSTKSKSRLLPEQISDFEAGRDAVVRKEGKTFVIDTQGIRADTLVVSDELTQKTIGNLQKLSGEQRGQAIESIRRTPFLSEEGKRERLDVLRDIMIRERRTERSTSVGMGKSAR